VSKVSRRQLLTGGGLTVLFSISGKAFGQEKKPHGSAEVRGGDVVAPDLPGDLSKFPQLDSWIRIDKDGRATVFTGKAELGQGIKTALRQLAIDELDILPEHVDLVTADTGRTPNEGYTAGSHSISDSGTAIANAAANVRLLLASEAARRWSVPLEQIKTRQGLAIGPAGQQLSYGQLASEIALTVPARPGVRRRHADHRRVIGQNMPRIDIPDKLAGRPSYVHDMRMDGMLHGRVVRGPSDGTHLTAIDFDAIRRIPGIAKIIRRNNFTALLASRQWPLVLAMRLIAAMPWQSDERIAPVNNIYVDLQTLDAEHDTILDKDAIMASAARSIAADYTRPYLMHGSIGPSCAVALYKDGHLTVWTHTQGVTFLRKAIAELVGLDPSAVRCIHAEGAGCYGHNGADDVAGDAALAAMAVPGRPVRMLWMREQEHGWEPLGPPMLTRAEASLAASGRIIDWHYTVWSNPHSTRPSQAGDLIAGYELNPAFPKSEPRKIPQPEGGGDRNAIPIYAFAKAKVDSVFVKPMPRRVSSLRGLGSQMNIFSIESFMDELAHTAGKDPVAYRLAHLDDPRAIAVVKEAAKRFGWTSYRRTANRAAGFAVSRYKNLASYCAVAIDMEVDRNSGEVILHRVVSAVDAGDVVNPDGVRNQIEGGILQTISWTAHEECLHDDHHRTSFDWSEYPIMRYAQVPRAMEVYVINRPGSPMLGAGEAAQGPASAAYANAVFAVTGVRIRSTPITPDKIRQALAL
jgi:CO/xanthine dehydrogenase Mo-binding subunit